MTSTTIATDQVQQHDDADPFSVALAAAWRTAQPFTG
jgi:hypothetical protein